jgi:sentrin-specific protease 7
MGGFTIKVPQQQNFTDCGLFLLQYVEHFFSHPIKDYRTPIKLPNWFDPNIVTRKREDIASLIVKLMKREGIENVEVPKIEFPTKDGVVIEPQQQQDNHMIPPLISVASNANHTNNNKSFMDDGISKDDSQEDPDYVPVGEEVSDQSSQEPATTPKKVYFSKKRSLDKNDNSGNGIQESSAKAPKLNKKQ